jgi:hypothetical protein
LTSPASQIAGDRFRRGAPLVGAAALAICAACWVFFPDTVLRSYLVAYGFWLDLALGSLPILMVYHLTGGSWGLLLRRGLEAATQTLPLLALLILPVLAGLPQLYPWARSEGALAGSLSPGKAAYLSAPFFVARTVVYFAVWIGLAYLLSRWSRQEDRLGAGRPTLRMRRLSGPGLVLYWLAMTFASADWVMSLQPRWYSTIFPAISILGQVLAAFAFAVVVAARLAARPPLAELAPPRTVRNLGNLLLTLVILWMYLAFSQFLLVWIANLPGEVVWYTPRFFGGWKWIAVGLAALQFGLPFLLLLPRRNRQGPERLVGICWLLLATSFMNLFWQIVPAFQDFEAGRGVGLLVHLPDLAISALAMVGVGGLWLGAFLRRLEKASLVPLHDPNLGRVAAHG